MHTIEMISEYRGYVLVEESTLLGELIKVRIYDKATRDQVGTAPSRPRAMLWINLAIETAERLDG